MVHLKAMTNTFLLRNGGNGLEVLLGKKKRGWMVDIWNGFGGKLEANETVEEAAARELQEESNVIGEDIRRIGMFFQTFEDKPDTLLEIHVFICEKWSGEIQETEEMLPKWFSADAMPLDQMWADDRVWSPWLLKKSCFYGTCHFKTDEAQAMLSHTFREVSRSELEKVVEEKGFHPK